MSLQHYANLHTHSTHSDGVYTPEQLVEIAKNEGYGALAVTDHDTITACEPVRRACEAQGLEWIFGAEFSSPCPALGATFHILGWHFDPEYPAMKQYLEERSYCETYQTRVLFERGVREGILPAVDWQEMLDYNAGITWICNEHLFRFLKSKGLMTDTDYPHFFKTAFGRRRGEVKMPLEFLPADKMIKLIHDAGGIAIVAHPHNQLRHMSELVRMGIDGTEVWHPDLRNEAERLEAIELAQKYDLFVSGGSDHSGLCGGQYQRYENPRECPFYHPELSLGTSEEFFREIASAKKSPDRAQVLEHYIALQKKLV